MIDQLQQRFQSMSPVMQFAVVGIIFIVTFLIWDGNIRPIGQQWAMDADEIEANLEKANNSNTIKNKIRPVAPMIRVLGEINTPTDEQATSEALHDAIGEILAEFKSKISEDGFVVNSGGTLPKALMTAYKSDQARMMGTSADVVINRLNGELEWESNVDTAFAIISKIEASPEIESVTKVQIRRLGDNKLKVNLSLEAWVLAERARRSRA